VLLTYVIHVYHLHDPLPLGQIHEGSNNLRKSTALNLAVRLSRAASLSLRQPVDSF